MSLFLRLKALVKDALEFRVDLELFQGGLSALVCLSFITIGEHFDQKLGVHLQHLAFHVHMIIKVVVALLTKLDLS